jgi:hypothetical protein
LEQAVAKMRTELNAKSKELEATLARERGSQRGKVSSEQIGKVGKRNGYVSE